VGSNPTPCTTTETYDSKAFRQAIEAAMNRIPRSSMPSGIQN